MKITYQPGEIACKETVKKTQFSPLIFIYFQKNDCNHTHPHKQELNWKNSFVHVLWIIDAGNSTFLKIC